jgi:chorismate dehydratase
VVARIPYLNAEPYYVRWGELPGVSMDLVPRRLGEEARAGSVDAGLMAVADFFDLEDSFERLGSLGVACHGEVESVLLLHGGNIEQLRAGRVLLTGESSTSARLCRLLLEERYKVRRIAFETHDFTSQELIRKHPSSSEGWLVIGDAALEMRRQRSPREILDLGSAWLTWTNLPFVFAVWVVRRDLPAESKEALRRFLEASLAEGSLRAPQLAAAYAERTAGRLGGAPELASYLRRIRYRLGPAEEAGMALFRERIGAGRP